MTGPLWSRGVGRDTFFIRSFCIVRYLVIVMIDVRCHTAAEHLTPEIMLVLWHTSSRFQMPVMQVYGSVQGPLVNYIVHLRGDFPMQELGVIGKLGKRP